jgi:hypothetical protein
MSGPIGDDRESSRVGVPIIFSVLETRRITGTPHWTSRGARASSELAAWAAGLIRLPQPWLPPAVEIRGSQSDRAA